MAVIFFGRRAYGHVREHGGEFAETEFIHLNLVPVIPVASHWITRDIGGERVGFQIRLHLPSVIAAYLRIWGPLGAMAIFIASGSAAATTASLALVALSAWSWTWRSRRGARTLQRSDFDRIALGSRCDPRWMTARMRRGLVRELDARLAQRNDARSPEDVARFGASDIEEAMLAYGLLRLRATEHPDAAAAAERLLDSAYDQLPADGGPYRERLGQSIPELRESVAAAVHAHAAADARIAAGVKPRWYQRPGLQLAGLVILSLCAGAMIQDYREGAGSTRTIGARELDGQPPLYDLVELRCDRIEDPAWQLLENDEPAHDVTFCWLGARLLPVVSPVDLDTSAHIEGTLEPISDHDTGTPWVASLRADPDLAARAYEVYVANDGGAERRRQIAIPAAYLFLAALGWVFWIRAFRRRAAQRR